MGAGLGPNSAVLRYLLVELGGTISFSEMKLRSATCKTDILTSGL